MQFIPSVIIPSVIRIIPRPIEDKRGFFLPTWDRDKFAAAGIDADFVSHGQSRSVRHTLRGLHYQKDKPQGKLIRVLSGSIFDVAVDLRRESRTFARWVGTYMAEGGCTMLWLPPGFAHGFLVLSDQDANVSYHCTQPHCAEDSQMIRWSDDALNIKWPLADGYPPVLSDKDANAPLFVEHLTSK